MGIACYFAFAVAAASDLTMFTLGQRKRLFAAQLLSEPQAVFKAGLAAWPDDPREGLRVAEEWVTDTDVVAICQSLQNEGVNPNLPTKEQLAREIIRRAEQEQDTKDAMAAYKLAADILGYITPPQTNINTRTTVNSRVMVVPSHDSEGEWEQRLKDQQRRLMSDHATDDATKH